MKKLDRQVVKISLFGHFGAANFGNESTLRAMLLNLERLVPDAEFSCICTRPDIVAADYNIPARSISEVVVRQWNLRNPFTKLARKMFIGIPSEVYRWAKGIKTLRNTDMLIVVGTGLLTDAFAIGGWGPYSTFKWSVIAKLCGCRLVFVSVGAGPLENRVARFFVKTALSLGDFRSYRDAATKKYLKSIGFDCDDDPLYPDLAFSLPTEHFTEARSQNRSRPVVGLGLMTYGGMYGVEKTTKQHYSAYLSTLLGFAEWLIDRGYDIRLLIGDSADKVAVREFESLLDDRLKRNERNHISAESINSSDDLLSQIAAADFVVATRFHNVLLSLRLGKPSIAISFHHKCSELMNAMELSEYCQHINRLDADKLARQFCELERNTQYLTRSIAEKAGGYRVLLEEQYSRIRVLLSPGVFAGHVQELSGSVGRPDRS